MIVKLKRRMDTAENRRFWAAVDRAAEKVAKLESWRKAGVLSDGSVPKEDETMGREKHTRTIGWLKSKGIHGKECLDELDSPIIRETGGERGEDWVVFEDEGKFWRMEVEYHPEDYLATNDLREWRNEPDHEMEVVEVVRRPVETWVEVGTADANQLAPDIDAYQRWTRETSVYPGCGSGSPAAVAYATLGLAGEAGEVAEKVKKWLRGDSPGTMDVVDSATSEKIRLELGDVLFYVARVATECGLTLSDVLAANKEKLLARKAAGTLKGSGGAR